MNNLKTLTMPTYRLLQINHPNGDYWIVVSNQKLENGDRFCFEADDRIIFGGFGISIDPEGKMKVIAQSRQVHEGIDLFDLPGEIDSVESLADEIEERLTRYSTEESSDWKVWRQGITDGINGTKEKYRFKEEDLKRAFKYFMYAPFPHNSSGYQTFDEFKKSISQPKQYQVELEMDRQRMPEGDDGWKDYYVPKLNSEGKITIKTIKEI